MNHGNNDHGRMHSNHISYDSKDSPSLSTNNLDFTSSSQSNIYFVYGSLMDPSTLQSALQTIFPPTLHPATLTGYHIKMWGSYPALLPSSLSSSVNGMVFEINAFEHAKQIQQRLEEYEGPNYKLEECVVEVRGRGDEGVRRVRARVFGWIGGEEELKEGVFDLKDYQMRKLE
ncbi:hypothetical protein D6C86_10619 [Aureobasidium pullulans]|uniref:Putative gamma-glutamylcyclotransferase n=1 Tax=Aureobasidium pullulans TaxID=5580 RepID=A0A4S9U8M9_AURPU|nr:hypothetical protein D6C94_10686 [Aureobasidium pullulans]THZ33706.1 hypothetical protein D6C87_10736 [Aureobasidium pullulans]THZ50739.1 hypothetical protein D6C86_10619 [Aureobasidium pullulans]